MSVVEFPSCNVFLNVLNSKNEKLERKVIERERNGLMHLNSSDIDDKNGPSPVHSFLVDFKLSHLGQVSVNAENSGHSAKNSGPRGVSSLLDKLMMEVIEKNMDVQKHNQMFIHSENESDIADVKLEKLNLYKTKTESRLKEIYEYSDETSQNEYSDTLEKMLGLKLNVPSSNSIQFQFENDCTFDLKFEIISGEGDTKYYIVNCNPKLTEDVVQHLQTNFDANKSLSNLVSTIRHLLFSSSK